jgi:hypothetical protein
VILYEEIKNLLLSFQVDAELIHSNQGILCILFINAIRCICLQLFDMANRVPIPANNSSLIAMIADEVSACPCCIYFLISDMLSKRMSNQMI